MDMNREMDQLERLIEGVRARYIMYFTGRDQVEPLQYRWQLESMVRRIQKEHFSNLAQANRFRAIVQKLGNYQSLWNRFRREKARKQGKSVDKEIEAAVRQELEAAGLSDMEPPKDAEEGPDRPSNRAVEPAAGEAFSPFQAGDAGSESSGATESRAEAAVGPQVLGEFEELFNKFTETKRMTGESTKGVTLEGFQKRMRGQVELLKEKYSGKEFVFNVVIKNGKVSLKAEPKG